MMPTMSSTSTPEYDLVKKRFNNITKSPNDDRLYRGLLLTNQMKVLLISDVTTDKSAAAMNIEVGYMTDPDDLPGLAHFCEHMLFLGTKKYPQQNDYNMYLSQNNGRSNAGTFTDHAVYYFDVAADKLHGALDRFAQFFIAPLFTETLTELELNAINSEHEKNLANDTWRLNQLEKSTANPNHAFSKFGTGNKQTLDIIPKEKGINVRERLLEYHNKYYSANIMSLCVLGKENLDELEEMVVKLFHNVPNKDVEAPIWLQHPFNEEHFQCKWYVVPIKDIRSLIINFPFPDVREDYRAMPAHYIVHLLGHEGPGSLLSALKVRGWCNSLIAGERYPARGFSFLNVSVDLTEEGIEHVDDIISLTFQYINLMKKKGPLQRIYEEYRDIADMNFRFKEKALPSPYVTSISQVLHYYPMEDALTAEHTFPEWKPELIDELMKNLIPANIRVKVLGRIYESIANESERVHGTRFKKERIPEEIIAKWESASISADLKLPARNEFIPTKFDIKDRISNAEKFPIIIEDSPFMRLWFKQDDEFLIPKANLTFDFVSPLAYLDPLNCNSTYIFVQLFRDSLSEYAYAADLAGLKWELNYNKYGIALGIGGYDHKQRVLLEKIMDKMVNFVVDPRRFEIIKENYIRNIKNFDIEQPYQHSTYYLATLLAEKVWLREELLDACSYLTVEKIQQFIPQLLSRIHIECLIHGNVTAPEAIDIVKLVESKLKSKITHMIPLLPRHMILYREIKLEDGSNFLFEIENQYHKSSCIQVYYQANLQSTETNMLLELLSHIIAEPSFNILRTKEQLGYIVFCGIQKSNGVQGLRVIVQSDRHPKYVESRIDAFMNTMMELISNMSDETFNKYKEALAKQRLEKPKMLNNLSAIFWNEITIQQYNFDRANIEVAYLRTITQEQLRYFFEKIVFSNTCQKLSVHVISTAEGGAGLIKNSDKVPVTNKSINKPPKKIEDIMSFKISQHLYPLLKSFNDIPRKGARSSKL